jgi:hypothetical protein
MSRRFLRTTAIAATCALAGAGAGIAGSQAHEGHFNNHGNHFGRFGRAPVHADLVVPAKGGTFQTVTFDRGTVDSVSGDQLTIKEGTKSATYKTITLTIPSDAKIRRNGEDAQLSDLQPGDGVAVVTSNGKTAVKAFSAKAEQQQQSGAESHSRRHRD